MSVIGNSPGVASQRVVSPFTATSGQTTFTPISGYTLGYCDVFLNGIKLANGDDYTAANGTTVVLAVGAALGDFVEVVAYFPRGLSDGYLKAEADARFPRVDSASQGLNSTQQGNARTNINAVNKAGDTLTGALTLVNNNIVSGIGRDNTPGTDGFIKDTSATGNRSPIAIRTGANTTVPWSIIEAGSTQNQSTPYGVLNLTRLNHDNASAAWACMFFESKDSSGSIREWGGVGSTRETIDGSDNRGRTSIFVQNSSGDNRRTAASWDYKGRMTNTHQPACSCSIGDNGSNRAVGIAGSTIIPIYPHSDYDGNVTSNRFTAPVAGLYHFDFNVEIQASAVGRFGVVLRKNGSQYFGAIEYLGQTSSSGWGNASASGNIPLAAGDYVELWTESVPTGAAIWYATNPGGNGNFSAFLIG